MKFVAAVNRYFGKNGQTMAEFAAEIKNLTPKDRADMIPELEKALGETIEVETTA